MLVGRLVAILLATLALISVGLSSAAAVNSPAAHITSLSFRNGSLGFNPTFDVTFSFDECPGWCLVDGTPVFTLHRGLDPSGPRVKLGTYLYRYQFTDAPAIAAGCSETAPCTVSGSTQLKPNVRSLRCRTRRPTVKYYTVVMSATVSEFSGEYPVSASMSMRVNCKVG